MRNIYEECLAVYEKGGQYAVVDYVKEHYPSTPWLWCDACEDVAPVDAHDYACLICGSPTTPKETK